MRLFLRKLIASALAAVLSANAAWAATSRGDKTVVAGSHSNARPGEHAPVEIDAGRLGVDLSAADLGAADLPVDAGLKEATAAPVAADAGLDVAATDKPAGDRAEKPEKTTLGELAGLAAAPNSAAHILDGVPTDILVERFLAANPAPTQAQFEKTYAKLAPRFARYFDVKRVDVGTLPEGGALLVANHVTWIDHFLIMMALKRPVRFIMDQRIFENFSGLVRRHVDDVPVIGPVVRWILAPLDRAVMNFLRAYAIPVLPRKDGGVKERNEVALRIAQALVKRGELVLIYPEGRRTPDGDLAKFGNGFMEIAKNILEPKIPIAIRGLWGSFLSSMPQETFRQARKKGARKVDVILGGTLDVVDVPTVRGAIKALGAVLRGHAR